MAYNSVFPATYQPYYPAYQQPVYQQQQPQSGINWVQGEAGAKSYLVAPNTTVQLWDSEAQVIYLKSADASGMPSMRVLDYTIRNNAPTAVSAGLQSTPGNCTNYATKDEIRALNDEITGIRAELESLTAKKTPAKKKAVAENE